MAAWVDTAAWVDSPAWVDTVVCTNHADENYTIRVKTLWPDTVHLIAQYEWPCATRLPAGSTSYDDISEQDMPHLAYSSKTNPIFDPRICKDFVAAQSTVGNQWPTMSEVRAQTFLSREGGAYYRQDRPSATVLAQAQSWSDAARAPDRQGLSITVMHDETGLTYRLGLVVVRFPTPPVPEGQDPEAWKEAWRGGGFESTPPPLDPSYQGMSPGRPEESFEDSTPGEPEAAPDSPPV